MTRNTKIANYVRTRRKAANLSQLELAELAGVGTRFISELERGKLTVRISEVEKVLLVFGKCLGIDELPRGGEHDEKSVSKN